MTPETYVFGSVYLSLIVVAMLFDSDPIEAFQKCARCGAKISSCSRVRNVAIPNDRGHRGW